MSEPTSTSALDAGIDPDVQPKKASWWEDYIDIFYTPSTVFRRRMTSGFGLPMLILTLVIGGLVLVNSGAISSIADAEFTRSTAAAIKANPQLTPRADAEGAWVCRGSLEGRRLHLRARWRPPRRPVPLDCGQVCWRQADARGSHDGDGVFLCAQGTRAGTREHPGPGARHLGDARTVSSFRGEWGVSSIPIPRRRRFLALLGRVDVFTIWVTVLLVIGLSVTGNISRGKAAIAGVIMWFIGAAAIVLPALRQ